MFAALHSDSTLFSLASVI